MELLVPQLMVEENGVGWQYKDCGENGFSSRELAVFHVESEHVYYDDEQKRCCRKVTPAEHARRIEEERFQEEILSFCRMGLCVGSFYPASGNGGGNGVDYDGILSKIKSGPAPSSIIVDHQYLNHDDRYYLVGVFGNNGTTTERIIGYLGTEKPSRTVLSPFREVVKELRVNEREERQRLSKAEKDGLEVERQRERGLRQIQSELQLEEKENRRLEKIRKREEKRLLKLRLREERKLERLKRREEWNLRRETRRLERKQRRFESLEEKVFNRTLSDYAKSVSREIIDEIVREIKTLERERERLERRFMREEKSAGKFIRKSVDSTINQLIRSESPRTHTPRIVKKYVREEFIAEYLEIRKKYARPLFAKEFRLESIIGYHHYLKEFGSWSQFLNEIGEKPPRIPQRTRKYTEEDLIQEYRRLEKELGRQPTYTDFRGRERLSGIHVSQYEKHFGTWGRFLEKVGGVKYATQKGPDKKALIKQFHDLKKKLGRRPTNRDVDKRCKYGVGYYRSRWGSYGRFLVDIGECQPGRFQQKKYTRKQLLEIYARVKKKTGHPPSQTDLRNNGVSESVYITEWGSWSRFKESVGDEINYHGKYTREDVMEAYRKARKDAGRVPHLREVIKYLNGTTLPVTRHFGGIKGLVEAMGDRYVRYNSVSLDTHYWRYLRARNELDRPPLMREYKEITGFWPDAACKRFGGYGKFVEYCEERLGQESPIEVLRVPDESMIQFNTPLENYPDLVSMKF